MTRASPRVACRLLILPCIKSSIEQFGQRITPPPGPRKVAVRQLNNPQLKAEEFKRRRSAIDYPAISSFPPFRHPGENRGVHPHPLSLDTVFQRYDGPSLSPGAGRSLSERHRRVSITDFVFAPSMP